MAVIPREILSFRIVNLCWGSEEPYYSRREIELELESRSHEARTASGRRAPLQSLARINLEFREIPSSWRVGETISFQQLLLALPDM